MRKDIIITAAWVGSQYMRMLPETEWAGGACGMGAGPATWLGSQVMRLYSDAVRVC